MSNNQTFVTKDKKDTFFKKKEYLFFSLMAIFIAFTQASFNSFKEPFLFKIDLVSSNELNTLLAFLIWLAPAFFLVLAIYTLLRHLSQYNKLKNSSFYEAYITELSQKKRSIFLIVFFFCLICWLPYFIAYFPGNCTSDTTRQLAMYFHLPTSAAGEVITDGHNTIYSAHHPVILTWVFGAFYSLGKALGNYYIGIAIYSLLQMAVTAAIFSWANLTLAQLGINKKIRLLILLYLVLSPNIAPLTVLMFSDLPFALAILCLIIILAKIVVTSGKALASKGLFAELIACALCIAFFKKTGFYIIIATLILLLIVYRKHFKRILVVLALVLVSFTIIFEGAVYKGLNIKESGKQEMLSLPFQQTARYCKEHPKELTKEEKDSINKVLKLKKIIKVYDPDLSDYVKNTFKRNSTSEELRNYFKTWVEQGKKHPETYWAAFLDGTCRYFSLYPNSGRHYIYPLYSMEQFYSFHSGLSRQFDIQLEDYAEYNVKSPEGLKGFRKLMNSVRRAANKMPVIGSIISIGASFIIVIACILYCFLFKKKRLLIVILPAFLNIIICLISPVNGEERYALPTTLAAPFLIPLMTFSFKKNEKLDEDETDIND